MKRIMIKDQLLVKMELTNKGNEGFTCINNRFFKEEQL